MSMRYKILGRSGLRVSELSAGHHDLRHGLGLGCRRGRQPPAQFELYTDAGGKFFDTADIYTNGTSERVLGELVAGER